jgi:guanylate kinase
VVACRLEIAARELREVFRYDYAVVNDRLDRAVADVLAIVRAERGGAGGSLAERFSPQRVIEAQGGLERLLDAPG